jgi:hypothetical protein
MRLFTAIFATLAFSTLAGCAAPTAATRGSDTAVRAEARRISNAHPYSSQKALAGSLDASERQRRELTY